MWRVEESSNGNACWKEADAAPEEGEADEEEAAEGGERQYYY